MPSLLKRKRKRAVASRTAHLHGSPKLASSSSSSSHYDPHISQEDEEIRRLERLLKVDALGGRQKLRKELGELDGLGEVYRYIDMQFCIVGRALAVVL